ncbi:18658_t:CDS:1, partial [Gigaspora rosea]
MFSDKNNKLIGSSSTSTAFSFTYLVTLLDYSPIAHSTNAYLTAFNSISTWEAKSYDFL